MSAYIDWHRSSLNDYPDCRNCMSFRWFAYSLLSSADSKDYAQRPTLIITDRNFISNTVKIVYHFKRIVLFRVSVPLNKLKRCTCSLKLAYPE